MADVIVDGIPQAVTPVVPAAVAPVAPIAPNPAPVEQAKPANPAPVASFTPNSGDSIIDQTVQNFAKAYGVSELVYQAALSKAIASGNPADVDYAALVKGAGPEAAAQAASLIQALASRVGERSKAAVEFVHTAAGGKDNWVAAATHFNTTAPEFVKQQMVDLLNSGDTAKMQYAVKHILGEASVAGVVQTSLAVQVGAGNPGSVNALSAPEFAKALSELRQKYPNRSMESGVVATEYNALVARREAGRKLGK